MFLWNVVKKLIVLFQVITKHGQKYVFCFPDIPEDEVVVNILRQRESIYMTG